MKIAIISDTHDNMANIRKVIGWLNKEKISLVFHCGDITRPETLNEARKLFKGEIKAVRGNGDIALENLPETEELEINNKIIAFTHFKEPAIELCKSGKYNLVFYGHTHKPWMEEINGCRLANPGRNSRPILQTNLCRL